MFSLFNKLPGIGVLKSTYHLLLGGIFFAVAEVLSDGSSEEYWFLANVAYVLSE